MKPKAFIFDLDGVLTDTAHYHYLAWKALADELNLKFDHKYNEQLKGISRIRSFEIILEINHAQNNYTMEQKEFYANKKNEQYVKLIDKVTPTDVLPGIIPFLQQSKQYGILLAVASASKNALKVLHSLEIDRYFDYIADAGKITNTKPDPEVFNVCCENLGVKQTECVGFEDAQAGIEAIHRAHMFSVGINVDIRTEAPHLILHSTEQLNVGKVVEAYEQHYLQSSNK